MAQLQLIVGSREQGHRWESLRLVQSLASNTPTEELRELAITALSSSDVQPRGEWHPLPFDVSCPPALDGALTRVALGGVTGGVHIVTYPDYRSVKELSPPGGLAGSLEWVNHDRWLAAVLFDGHVLLWEATSGNLLFATNGCHGPGHGQRIAVHPEGQYLAMSGTNQQLRLFDLSASHELASVTLPAPVESLAFASGGGRLAVSLMDRLQVREFPSLRLLTEDPNGKYFANRLVWEPGDRWVFAAMQGWNVVRWHPGQGQEGQILASGHDAAAVFLCRNETSSLLASSGADNTSYLWDASNPFALMSLPRVVALRFAGSGNQFALWHKSQGLATFETVVPAGVRQLTSMPPHTFQLLSSAPHPSLPLVAAASQYHAAIFDLQTGEERAAVERRDCAGAFLSEDGTRLFTVESEGVQLWRVVRPNATARCGWELKKLSLLTPLGTNFSPQAASEGPGSGRFLAAGASRTIVVDLRRDGVVRDYPPPERSSFPAAASDGSWWAYSQTSPEGTWLNSRSASAAERRRLSDVGGRLARNAQGTLLAVAGSSRVECFDTRTWRRRWSVPIELSLEVSGPCAFSDNGQWLGVSLTSHDAVLLSANDGRILVRFKPPSRLMVLGVNFGPGSKQLLVTTMRSLQVWDLPVIRGELAGLGLDWSDPAPSR